MKFREEPSFLQLLTRMGLFVQRRSGPPKSSHVILDYKCLYHSYSSTVLLYRGKLYRRVKDAAAHGRYSYNRSERRSFFTLLPRSSREIKLSQRAHLYLVGDFLLCRLSLLMIFLIICRCQKAIQSPPPLDFFRLYPKSRPLPPTNNVRDVCFLFMHLNAFIFISTAYYLENKLGKKNVVHD